jgi:ABC-type sugar transport system substrate-binding protein
MKKAMSVLLAMLLLLSLFSCTAKTPAATPTPPPPTAAPPAGDNTPAPPPPAGGGAHGGFAGYWDDEVDHFARDTYKIAFFSFFSGSFVDAFYTSLQKTEKKMNIKIDFITANSDPEKFINTLELMTSYDGVLLDHDINTEKRTWEIMTDLGVPWIAFVTPFMDGENGSHNRWPTIILDGNVIGRQAVTYLCENYKQYWGDIDTSKLGMISLDISTVGMFLDRSNGAHDAWMDYFPDNVYISGDTSGQQFTTETAYNMISAYVSSHPEIEYWFINTVMMLFPAGCARAVETLGIEEKCLITCEESITAIEEWDSGYRGAWSSCVGVAEELYAVPAAAGIVALLDGRATPETLWGDNIRDPYGSDFAVYPLETQVITYDTYKQYFADINTKYFA